MNQSIKKPDWHIFVLSVLALVALILDYGYPENYWHHLITDIYYMLHAWMVLSFMKSTLRPPGYHRKVNLKGTYVVFGIVIILAMISVVNTIVFVFFENKDLNFATALLVFLVAMFDLSGRLATLDRQSLHPALVFVISFLILIFIGTLLLMLPNSTNNGISFVDALFTSTSAVCVTGLAVLDTGKDFTHLGQFAILFLIQFGALGMLSFTSLFGLLFKGFGSYENRLNLKNLINADTLGNTFKTLIQILVFVIAVEIVGAILIYYTVGDNFRFGDNRWFFSFFHSISAFCNAGFSTLSNSLYESDFRFNYSLHLVIAVLIILGGIGYGVIINLYRFSKKSLQYRAFRWFDVVIGSNEKIKPFLSLNTKIVLVTTLILIVVGAGLFYLLEYDNTLKEHSAYGKIVESIFGSVTTRTAGFNTVDTGALTHSCIMIVLLLMWIGASPGSTGGGIKTTTFAVATLNIYQQALGFKSIRVGWKRIDPAALQRSTSIISLSLIVIGISTFLLVTFDEHLGILAIAFECFSAFSTVGLSMGITADLSVASKVVIIITMFIGRVGLLTLLTGIARQFYKYRYKPIQYPEEKIFIN
ncbi:MAG: ATPase [Flammeovirgaceae bacterium]|nr:ATPase [Flammeovirgaceae bacterium]MBE63013.1 ATPase [Flammeovirgaceae bacterium]MBR07085.1 ATPase [Rickettsiales bacterium]HCX24926.1 ATPase [Cytophagales bacterium]